MIRRVTCLLVLVLASFGATAREAVVGMSEPVFNAINEAQQMIDAGDYDGAREVLGKARSRRVTRYEQAHLLNLMGYTWYEQDEIGKARALYEEAVALPRLPDSMVINLVRTLGQVCLVEEDYAAAEKWLVKLLAMPGQETPANKVLLAGALMGQQRYREALAPLREAVDSRSQEGGEKPRENWLSMLASVHYELKDYPAMRAVVQDLVRLYPREQYLINLAALHGQLGETRRQLSLVEALLDDGRLQQEHHLKMVANLFLAEELPYKAAVVLQREMERGRIATSVANLELLSQAWLSAAETGKAIPPLTRAAALAENGELYLRVAQLHMDGYDWERAEEAARRALAKGGLRREGHAWLLRGMAQVRMHRLTEARALFARAGEFEETARYAEQWLAYVAQEEEKQKSLGVDG